MIPAPSIEHIEARASGRATRSVLCICAEYSHGLRDGAVAEFLARADSFHEHSGSLTDLHCIGYGLFEQKPEPAAGRFMELPGDHWPLKFFYPEAFHAARQRLSRGLGGNWNYDGGVDLLLFPANMDSAMPVDWSRAVVARSRRLVPTPFDDVEQMVRFILNLNEKFGGQLVPDQMRPELARAELSGRLKQAMAKFDLIGAGMSLITGIS